MRREKENDEQCSTKKERGRERMIERQDDEREGGVEKPSRNITSFYLGSSASLKLEHRRQSEKEEEAVERGR